MKIAPDEPTMDTMNKLKFWLKEYYLRFTNFSWIMNQTQYNPNTDKILNECLDNLSIAQICRATVKFTHPNGETYVFWTASWLHAYGHAHSRYDYMNHGVYYTTRLRLKNVIDRIVDKHS